MSILERLAAVEARLDALEAAGAVRGFYDQGGRLFLQVGTQPPLRVPGHAYQGTWEPGRQYRVGDTVTWDGHCWVCTASDTPWTPGEGRDSGFAMIVRRGKAGKSGAAPGEDNR